LFNQRFLLVDDDMDTLTSFRVFNAVAELRNFSAAAARLGISAAMASKHIMHLEQRLSARLLNRTSRSVSLTEIGALYLEQTRAAIEGLDEVEASIGNTAVSPRGMLRVSAPVWMANPIFARMLADYRHAFPEVQLDIDLSGRLVNLVDEGFDIALRATVAPDPSLITRLLTRIKFRLVASPLFLQKIGRPSTLQDLEDRELLAYVIVPPDGRIMLDSAGGKQSVRFRPVLRSGNETLLHLAALQGMGLAFLPSFLIEQDLATGALITVLPENAVIEASLYAIYPSRKYLSSKVRTFIDHLAGPRGLRLADRRQPPSSAQ
jgi:DNA-binding transcriptional LysR family regulator